MGRGLVLLAMVLGLWACSAAPPQVPPAAPNSGECRVTPPEGSKGPPIRAADGRFLPAPLPATSDPAGLEVTLPSRAPQSGLPLRLPALLSQPKSPSSAQWRALPNGSDAAMTAIVSNASESTPIRVRAVAGLAARASSIGLGTLRELIVSARVANPIGQAAIAGFDAFYGTAPGVVEGTLGGVLRTGDTALRIEAVRTLGRLIGQGGVRALLEAHRATEKAPAVRMALEAALKGATAR